MKITHTPLATVEVRKVILLTPSCRRVPALRSIGIKYLALSQHTFLKQFANCFVDDFGRFGWLLLLDGWHHGSKLCTTDGGGCRRRCGSGCCCHVCLLDHLRNWSCHYWSSHHWLLAWYANWLTNWHWSRIDFSSFTLSHSYI